MRALLDRIEEGLLDYGEALSDSSDVIIVRVLGEDLGKNFGREWVGFLDSLEGSGISEEGREWLSGFESSRQVCGLFFSGGEKVVAERVVGRQKLFVMGAGHVGQAVALMAALLGYDVTVVDDRPEFARREKFPDANIKLVVESFETAIEYLDIDEKSAVVIVTRGHQFDETCLRLLLKRKTRYLGMIGSKRRVLSIFRKLEMEGMSRADFEKVRAPIGLAIGAVSPQEIAVAILAEIISEIRNGKFVMEDRCELKN